MRIDPRLLLAALSDRHAVSGAKLATDLGVSRAAVWKQIEALRQLGAPIEAAAGSGYRLAWPFEPLDAQCIRALLAPRVRPRLSAIDVYWQIDSTSTELQRIAADGVSAARLCVAEMQSAGRGRRGRSWRSPLGGNLYFSLLWPFERGMGALSGLSLVVGVAVSEALADSGVADVGIKWPNDILARGCKLAGILVELGGEFLGPCHAVIGIGINLRLGEEDRAAIDQPAIDVATLVESEVLSRNLLAARLVIRLVDALDRFSEKGFVAFHDDFVRRDLLAGRAIRVVDGAGERDGVAAGVDERGALLVRRGSALTRVDSAEVSIRAA